MTNTCPSCGVLYNVTSKDVGRRLKCKKCSAALRVTDAGLEPDAPDDEPLAHAEVDARRDDDRDEEPRQKKKKNRGERLPGVNPLVLLGGVPTILFGVGVLLVIVFISFPIIGQAAGARADAYTKRLENDREREKFDIKPRKPRGEWSEAEKTKVDEETPKIEARYDRLIEEAKLDATRTRLANARDVWFEQYGVMFGFLFMSFGCIAYMRTEQPLVLKIVAGTILTLTMLVLLGKFSGCAVPR